MDGSRVIKQTKLEIEEKEAIKLISILFFATVSRCFLGNVLFKEQF